MAETDGRESGRLCCRKYDNDDGLQCDDSTVSVLLFQYRAHFVYRFESGNEYIGYSSDGCCGRLVDGLLATAAECMGWYGCDGNCCLDE